METLGKGMGGWGGFGSTHLAQGGPWKTPKQKGPGLGFRV